MHSANVHVFCNLIAQEVKTFFICLSFSLKFVIRLHPRAIFIAQTTLSHVHFTIIATLYAV